MERIPARRHGRSLGHAASAQRVRVLECISPVTWQRQASILRPGLRHEQHNPVLMIMESKAVIGESGFLIGDSEML